MLANTVKRRSLGPVFSFEIIISSQCLPGSDKNTPTGETWSL